MPSELSQTRVPSALDGFVAELSNQLERLTKNNSMLKSINDRFSFEGKDYILHLSKPNYDYCWYSQYRPASNSHLRGLGIYTTTAHAVRGARRTITEKEKTNGRNKG